MYCFVLLCKGNTDRSDNFNNNGIVVVNLVVNIIICCRLVQLGDTIMNGNRIEIELGSEFDYHILKRDLYVHGKKLF